MPVQCCRHDVARLIVHVQADSDWINKKAGHLAISRFSPADLLRNAEVLEDRATRLQVHARQIIRRVLESQE